MFLFTRIFESFTNLYVEFTIQVMDNVNLKLIYLNFMMYLMLKIILQYKLDLKNII